MSEPNMPLEIVDKQPMQVAAPTPMHLIQMAMSQDFDIDKLERLLKFQQDSDARIAEQAFNAALCAAQSEIGRIAPNAKNDSTRSEFAKIDKIDGVIRPIYIKHGFSISFDSANHTPENIDVVAIVTHVSGHTKKYTVPIPCDGKGAKGGDVMTKTHAMGSAMSYGRRYLLINIFNIAIGKDDDDGNGASEARAQFAACVTVAEVQTIYAQLFKQAQGTRNAKLMLAVTDAKDKRRKEIEDENR